MKLFSWVQKKLNRNDQISHEVSANYHIKPQHGKKEEFSDWPHGLLTIGTFGNNDLQTQNPEIQMAQEEEDYQSSSPDLHDFAPEEMGKLQKELSKLLKRKPSRSIDSKEIIDHPLNKFLNCPSSLEVDRRICESFRANIDEADRSEEDIDRTISVLLGRCKDVCAENKKTSIGKNSVSFLLKKVFVCTGGFFPAPGLRDSLSESKLEKILRTMLHKKIKPQSSSRPSSMKRYLDDKQVTINRNEDEKREKVNDGCKWVKTDSEYIVLEI